MTTIEPAVIGLNKTGECNDTVMEYHSLRNSVRVQTIQMRNYVSWTDLSNELAEIDIITVIIIIIIID